MSGAERTGRLFVPAEYDGSKPWALVLGFHGTGGTGSSFESVGFDAVAGELGFIMCYPDGVRNEWNSPEDVAFVSAILDGLKKEFSIDPARVYATGHSAGAVMTYRLAQVLPGAFAAVAPVAGLMPEDVAQKKLAPVSVLHLHAVDDDVVRIGGVPEWSYLSMEASVGAWKRAAGAIGPDGASGDGTVFVAANGVRGTLWRGPSADIATIVYSSGKHAWPQDAVGYISEFFYNHPARALSISLMDMPESARSGSSLTLSLSDPRERRIARVGFYDNGRAVGEATSAPWALEWKGVPKGYHRVTARATLADGSEVRTARARALWVASPSLAEGRPVRVSGSEGPGFGGEAAVDGNPRTRWSSAADDDEWLQVDLGAGAVVDGFTLFWESAFGRAYAIELSDDGAAWTVAYSTDRGAGGVEFVDIAPTKARYARVRGIARGTSWGYSLWEFLVNGERSQVDRR